MKKKTIKGLAYHCHHSILIEYVYNYQERIDYIKKNKSKDEIELRLKLFTMIPDNQIPNKDSEEYKTYCQAWDAWDAARKAWDAYYKKYEKEILILHDKLCGCNWTGNILD